MSASHQVLSRVTPPGNAYGVYGRGMSGSSDSGESSPGDSGEQSNVTSTTTTSTTPLITSTSTTTSTTSSLLTSTTSYFASTIASTTSLLTSAPTALIANVNQTIAASVEESSGDDIASTPMYIVVGSVALALTSAIVFLVLKKKYDREDEDNTYMCDEVEIDTNDYVTPFSGYAPQAMYCEPVQPIEMTYSDYEPTSYDNVNGEMMQMYDFASEESQYEDGGYMLNDANQYDVAGGGSFYEEGCENSYELASGLAYDLATNFS